MFQNSGPGLSFRLQTSLYGSLGRQVLLLPEAGFTIDVFWDAPIHPSHKAEPPTSALPEKCEHGKKTCSRAPEGPLENLGVDNLVAQADAKDATEAAQTEAVQSALLFRVGRPCFFATEEGADYPRHLGCCCQLSDLPGPGSEAS